MLNITDYKDAEKVFFFFEEISKIPHPSENTSLIANYLTDFAKARGLWYTRDEYNNVIIRKPATPGYENRPGIIIQGHTDMVADKVASCNIDMNKEGLKLFRDGDFIRAEGTTLGGDDGVAIAYALAILDSSKIEHPELEALFTSDEEIGLIGATALDASLLRGKTMINIDSDVEGIFTVGCAGGMRMDAELKLKKSSEEKKLLSLSVTGLLGGHSGTEIDKGRTNAIKVLGELLAECSGVQISDISGGNADNAIPRYAQCSFCIADGSFNESLIEKAISKYKAVEPDIQILLKSDKKYGAVFSVDDSNKIIELICKLPSGVAAMSRDIPNLPETSSNLGIAKTDGDTVSLSVSLRSSKNSEKEKLRLKVREISEGYGASVGERGEYPAWEYRRDSHLRDIMKDVYTKMYDKEPEIITIHAGLECGIFSNKIEGLDCVSIGPNNYDIHTPEERLSISSTARVWEFLKNIIKEI
jgi:dipeptidase D